MSYLKAIDVLPEELLRKIQDYIDGETIYIPRRTINKKAWGENTKTRESTAARNNEIFRRHAAGTPVNSLSETYYLSPKSIQKIIVKLKLQG
ncbi:hypothetical protein SDC9_204585 [bioreactor metagenome]|uniref:Mor transcription activator domain-containing protein n=1 Tax=bioreactor metagenome TaxID=1076179 RepID=A0A645J1B0_9ZZZZ